eukprot:SAG31_NODE_27382_length_427_cov_0.390244_1_plen_93_part_01
MVKVWLQVVDACMLSQVHNGLMVAMVKDKRRLEMITGIGMDKVVPGRWLKEMQGDVMVPCFRRGDFGDGLHHGMYEVERRIDSMCRSGKHLAS